MVVAIAFLIYTIYSAITATVFISHFPTLVARLPQFFNSSQPTLQLGLFLLQELSMFVGSLLRLIGAAFALHSAILFSLKDPKYVGKLRFALLFESLYFLLLFPTAINHLVGSVISTSAFLNVYTGFSALLQVLLIFPALFMLSVKLKNPHNAASILRWAGLAGVLYVLGFWVKGSLMWVYAIYPVETPWSSLVGVVGFANSSFTLLVAAVVSAFVVLSFRKTHQFNLKLAGTLGVLVGGYFLVNDVVSFWDPIYRAFLLLTDFWMISLLVLGAALLLDSRQTVNV